MARVAAFALGVLAGIPLFGGVAAATSATALAATACDPAYGCTPPPPPSSSPSCSLSAQAAAPGTRLFGTITDVPVGTKVTLTFDGNSVGSAVATSDGSGEQAAGLRPAGHLGVSQASASGGAVVNFSVPADASQGEHAVVFTGVGVSCDAAPGGLAVEGLAITRPVSRSPLARTGIEVALIVAIGLALLIVGIQLVHRARARRSRMLRPQYRVRDYNRL